MNFALPLGKINLDLWAQLAQEFASHDSEIKRVILNTKPGPEWQNSDCAVGATGIDKHHSIDNNSLDIAPLMAADSTVDPKDFVGNSLNQLTYDNNKISGYPLAIDLAIIKYDPMMFNKAGVPLPTSDWTINQFIQDLHDLKTYQPDSTPFEPSDNIVSTIPFEMPVIGLMAAYGASPLNFDSEPVTINTADPAVIAAAQQALDLAKNGYIKYHSISQSLLHFYTIGADHPAMQNDVLTAHSGKSMTSATAEGYQYVLYPQASDHKLVVYGLTIGDIRKDTAHPQACYRWIRYIANHPELFPAMPASRAQIDNPNLLNLQGTTLIGLYKKVDNLLSTQGAVSVPLYTSSLSDFFVDVWLSEAFDKYVLNGADLQQSLNESAALEQNFLTQCLAPFKPDLTLSPYDRDRQSASTLGHCAQKLDPILLKFGFG